MSRKGLCPLKGEGFTLIELLIVVAIIAILAAIAVPNFLEAQTRARVSRTVNDMRTIATAMESYAVDHNTYPLVNYTYYYNPPAGYYVYRSYTHYLLDTIDGAIRTGVFSLTSPIAYLASPPPKDQFRSRPSQTDPTWLRRWTSYWYANVDGAFKQKLKNEMVFDPNVGTGINPNLVTPQPLRLNGPNSPIYPAAWHISSCGPSQHQGQYDALGRYLWELHYLGQNYNELVDPVGGGLTTYDPSNGTMSKGLIMRTSAGIVP